MADYVTGEGDSVLIGKKTCGESTGNESTTGTQDYIGAFALTAGVGLKEFTEKLKSEGDNYNAIMAKLLADRLTEAFAESVHEFIRRVAWGYQRPEGIESTENDEIIMNNEAVDCTGATEIAEVTGISETAEFITTAALAEPQKFTEVAEVTTTTALAEAPKFTEIAESHETIRAAQTPPHDAVRGKYRGLRFAFGYPATPDHSLKQEIFALLGVEQMTAMRLTDNYMIDPGESLCGLFVADADAEYFTLGTLTDDQIEEYALRRGKTTEEIRKLIGTTG